MPDDLVTPMTGAELRAARSYLGMSQPELGNALGGVDRATIARWETGSMRVKQPGVLRLALLGLIAYRQNQAGRSRPNFRLLGALDLGDGTAIVGVVRVSLEAPIEM